MKILYIEDDYIFAVTLKLLTKEIGHDCVIAQDYAEGIKMFKQIEPDILIVDVNLKGQKDGIQLVEEIRPQIKVPLIFLTSELSDEVFDRARKMNPFTFLNKPISVINLRRVIELALSHNADEDKAVENENDSFFIREGQKFVKFHVEDTNYIEVQDKYCTIHGKKRSYTLRIGLKDLKESLPENFIQIHRSYVINIDNLESLNQSKREVNVSGTILPIGRNFYDNLKTNLNYLEKIQED